MNIIHDNNFNLRNSVLNNDKSYIKVILLCKLIGIHCLVGRVFANGPGDLCSIPGRVIPKTLKMVLDTSLFNTQHYKVHIKGKVKQFRGRSSTFPYILVW